LAAILPTYSGISVTSLLHDRRLPMNVLPSVSLIREVWPCWVRPEKYLNISEGEVFDHVDAMRSYVNVKDKTEMNDWLVANLDTLDRKAQGILLLNAIIMTIATVLYTQVGSTLGNPGLVTLIIVIALLMYSCASVALLNVVYWSSTKELHGAITSNSDELLSHLLRLRDLRTRIVWSACWRVILCLAAILGILIANTAMS
jgi:hypothetical protein